MSRNLTLGILVLALIAGAGFWATRVSRRSPGSGSGSSAPSSTFATGSSCRGTPDSLLSCGGTNEAPVAAIAPRPDRNGTASTKGMDQPKPAPRTADRRSIAESIPARSVLKQEAMEDPHATPVSLIRFSVELGRRVRDALGTEETARGAFQELKDCAAVGDVVQVQTLCLSQAKIVKDKYRSLGGAYDDLLKQVPPKVKTLAQLIE